MNISDYYFKYLSMVNIGRKMTGDTFNTIDILLKDKI